MLVLSRKVGEAIFIGDGGLIKVVVVENRDGIVRLGIEAPRSIPIHREEVFEHIEKEERKRAKWTRDG